MYIIYMHVMTFAKFKFLRFGEGCQIIITPRACTRDKVIGSAVIVMGTKIVKSEDLGT